MRQDKMDKQIPTFMTIKEVAKTGLVSENYLRKMHSEGRLPGIQTGKWFRINYEQLVEQLNRESAENVKTY